MKYIKTIEQKHGELKISVFEIDGEVAYDVVFTPIKRAGENFTTEIHNNSPLLNHEVIIAIDEYFLNKQDLESSGIPNSPYFVDCTTHVKVPYIEG